MDAQVALMEVPDADGKRAKINALLLEILPGSTTLAEMEMIGDNVFGMVESWWRSGSVMKKQIPVPKPPVERV
jgi:hypothetical protein